MIFGSFKISLVVRGASNQFLINWFITSKRRVSELKRVKGIMAASQIKGATSGGRVDISPTLL